MARRNANGRRITYAPHVVVRDLAPHCVLKPDGSVVRRNHVAGREEPATMVVEVYLAENPVFGASPTSASSVPSGASRPGSLATAPRDDPALRAAVERELAGAPDPAMRGGKPAGSRPPGCAASPRRGTTIRRRGARTTP